VYKFLVETQESPPIEYSANPVDNQHVMVRIPKIWMIGHPDIKPMFQSDINMILLPKNVPKADCVDRLWRFQMTGLVRARYTLEFKQEAVRLVWEGKRSPRWPRRWVFGSDAA